MAGVTGSPAAPPPPPSTPVTALPASRFGSAGDALRLPAFRVLIATQLVVGLTQPILFFTQGWWVNRASPDGAEVIYLGLLGASRGLVFLLYVTVGGAVADRFPRRRVLRLSATSSVLLILCIDALLWVPAVREGQGAALPLMIALFATFGLIMAQDLPTRTSMVREALPDHLVGGGIAFFQLAISGALVFAGPFAGWSIERFGIPATYVMGVGGPAGVLLLSLLLPRDVGAADPEARQTSILANVTDGVRVLREEPVVRWVVLLTWISTASALSVMGVLIAAWVDHVLGLDAAGWGRLAIFWGLGSLVASVTLTARNLTRRRGRFFLGASMLLGASVLGFSLSRALPLAYLFNGLAGMSFMAFNIAGLSIVQAIVPNRFMGRVTGLLLLGNGLMQVVALGVGILAGLVGIESVYVAAGIVILGASTMVAVAQRPLRTLD